MAVTATITLISSADLGELKKEDFPITISVQAVHKTYSLGDILHVYLNTSEYDAWVDVCNREDTEAPPSLAKKTFSYNSDTSNYELEIFYEDLAPIEKGQNTILVFFGDGAEFASVETSFTFIKESETGLFIGVSKLPNEYQQIEYLESTGMQYIDTGVSGNAIGTYEIKFNMLGEGYQNYEMYFAGPLSAQVPKLYLNGDTAIVADIGTAAYDLFTKDNNPHIIKITNTEILCDNIIKATYEAKSWGDQSFWLFNAAEQSNLYSTMRLYYLKMYSDGVLVRNYIPCYKKEDNISGLYDIVNNIFYENEGAGNFVAGQVIKGIAKKAIDIFIGKDGVAKRVKEAFIGINGIAKKVFEASPLIINFIIGGTSYQAEEGMTWNEWVFSEYNDINEYTTSESYIVSNGTNSAICLEDGTFVTLEDIIIKDYSYSQQLTGNMPGY